MVTHHTAQSGPVADAMHVAGPYVASFVLSDASARRDSVPAGAEVGSDVGAAVVELAVGAPPAQFFSYFQRLQSGEVGCREHLLTGAIIALPFGVQMM